MDLEPYTTISLILHLLPSFASRAQCIGIGFGPVLFWRDEWKSISNGWDDTVMIGHVGYKFGEKASWELTREVLRDALEILLCFCH